jgi:hypothetical protein
VPGTPLSLTCSVHSVPDQYRCSCLKKGSVNQAGAVPAVAVPAVAVPAVAVPAVAVPAVSRPTVTCDPAVGPGAGPRLPGLVNELPGGGVPLRRCEDRYRIANVAPKTARMIHEPWP